MVDINTTETHSILEVKYVPSTPIDKIQELRPENDIKRPDTLFLYFTIITALLVIFTSTTAMVWASPAIIKLKSYNSNVNPLRRPITTIEISMLLGTPLLVAVFGSIFLSKFADIIGRKRSLQAIGFLIFFSMIALAFSKRVEFMILFLSIFSTLHCTVFMILPVYITEICEDHNRAKFGCLLSVFIPLGNLFTYIVGPLFSFTNFTLVTAAPLTIFLLLLFFAPETPIYLLTKGKQADCMKTLKQLRSNKTDGELQIDFINISKQVLINKKQSNNNIFTLFKNRESRIGAMLVTMVLVIRVLSGVLVVMTLLAPIFNEAGTNLSGDAIAVITGLISVLSALFTCLIVEKFGKKQLLLVSTVGTGLCVSILGLYFFLKHINFSLIYQIQWLPVVSVSLYIIFYSVGLGPIPVAVAGELFLSNIRSVGVAFGATVGTFSLCILNFSYPVLSEIFGTHWCLWSFGILCFIGAVLMYILLPETKGKSIIEIQEMLTNY